MGFGQSKHVHGLLLQGSWLGTHATALACASMQRQEDPRHPPGPAIDYTLLLTAAGNSNHAMPFSRDSTTGAGTVDRRSDESVQQMRDILSIKDKVRGALSSISLVFAVFLHLLPPQSQSDAPHHL